MKLPQSVSKTYAVALVATIFLGLGTGGQCSPQLTPESGYHTDQVKPSEAQSSLPESGDESRQAILLQNSLQEIKSGDLTTAAQSLNKLILMAPEEPRYAQLLALVRRQQQMESWYRYQSRFRLGWAGN